MVLGKADHCSVNVRTDSWNGRIAAVIDCRDGKGTGKLQTGVIGKHAVYFEFILEEDKTVTFDRFTFD